MKFNLILIIVIGKISRSDAQTLHPPCTPKLPDVTLSAPDIEQIGKFFESLEITPKILDDAKVTEMEIFADVLAYKKGADNEDVHMYITDLIEKYGFDAEEHNVTTEDGYKLTMQRIPCEGRAVLLMHGLFSSADDFVTAGRESALAYYLATRGFDVWMGNGRGNKHSRNHVSLSPECDEFWDFSCYEGGRYDLPAMIDKALEISGKTKLAIVGHSLGNTDIIVMGSELPEYVKKVSVAIALCPLAWFTHMKSPPFRLIAVDNDLAYSFSRVIGLDEVLPDSLLIRSLKDVFCGNNLLAELLCSNIAFFTFGFDRGQLNVTNLPVTFGHSLAGASTKQVIHVTQQMQSGKFCQFDYGDNKKNMKKYGRETPPEYSLKNVTIPIALFYSNNDWISNITDVEKLRDNLPNVVKYYFVENYFHFDYLWAKNINKYINPVILDLIEKYL